MFSTILIKVITKYINISTDSPLFTQRKRKRKTDCKIMEKKKMNAVAAMAMVLIILLSANMDTISVAAQGLNCYDNCNTGCAGLPSAEYLICDKKCHEMCGDGNSLFLLYFFFSLFLKREVWLKVQKSTS
ncbi:uncharacterized protein LOC129885801 [Solanum dulcamara]|uniref:uncharacterized protein LOC129885801 n=1 Tax=Solanum dulcamara TaxID=45834 RepID=UPI002485B459|nr:uncharacterized protein LOC129885801 [Solanum dulcamara]